MGPCFRRDDPRRPRRKGGDQSRIALRFIRATVCRGARASIHHDLHAIPWLDLRVLVEAVEDAEALGGAVDAGHAVG